MEDESIKVSLLLGAMGFASMLVIGVLSVMGAKLIEHQPVERATLLTDSFQVVDGPCVEKLGVVQAEKDFLNAELAKWKLQLELARTQEAKTVGHAVAMPDPVAPHQTEEGFTEAVGSIAEGLKGAQLVMVNCEMYPCIAVFTSARIQLGKRLRSPFRDRGFVWSEHWIGEGRTSHAQGTTFFTALRFYSRESISTANAQYLSLGLDHVLDRAMIETVTD